MNVYKRASFGANLQAYAGGGWQAGKLRKLAGAVLFPTLPELKAL